MAATALSSYLPSSPSVSEKGEKKDKEIITPGGGDSLEDDVTCPACSERMDGPPGRRIPKVLHCLHTLCLPCLEKSWAINNKVNVSCPICKTMTALPKDKGPSGLTNNFTVIRILELLALDAEKHIICEDCVEARNSKATHRCLECRLYLCDVHTNAHQTGRRTAAHALLTLDEVKKSEEAKNTIGARAMCSREGHDHYELSLYCETCDLVICLACTIVDHARPHHQYDFVNKAVKKHKDEINQLLTMAKGCVTKLQRTLASVQETQKRVGVRGTEIQESVKRSFETLRNELSIRENVLLGELNSLVTGKERVLASQARDVSFALDNLSIGTGFCEGMLLGGTDVQVLTVRAQLMKRLAELNDLRADSEPKTNERMNFGVDLVSVTAQIAHIGWIRDSTVFGPHCYGDGDGLRTAYMDEEARFNVVTCDKDGKEIKDGGEQLTISLIDEKRENALAKAAHVKDNGDGSYLVTFTPRNGVRGKCLLSILIRGVHIRESPFSVFFQTPGQDTASSDLSTAEGDGLLTAFPGKAATFHIIARDSKGLQRTSGGDGFEVEIKADSKLGDPEIDMKDNTNGTYTVIYTLPNDAKGDCIVSVYLDTKHIKGSPFTIPLPNTKAIPKELGIFQEWLSKDPNNFRLLYRATRDGWSTKEFHTRCDGQGPSITVVRLNSGHLFGGYTSGSWKSAGGMFLDPDSFLFSITDGKNRKPYKCLPVAREKGAVVHHSEFGPVWCGGADLSLRLDTGKLHESYSRLQGRYRLPEGFADQSDSFLAGKYSGWDFAEVEIYAV